MGVNRDLKKATEAYWGSKLSQEELLAEGKRLRLEHWKIQKDAGIDIIPSNDFSYYDHVLDHIQFFGVSTKCSCATMELTKRLLQAIPERYTKYNLDPIDEFFAMGRGLQKPAKDGQSAVDVPSLVCSVNSTLILKKL